MLLAADAGSFIHPPDGLPGPLPRAAGGHELRRRFAWIESVG
ncbi:MAG: hypothetical protein R2695_13990 [Acidimicrobiales bacterium]